MATLFEDFFTDTNGTALESHTPDTGTGWAAPVVGTGYDIQSNRAAKEQVTVAHTANGVTENDYQVYGDVEVASGNDRHGLMVRVTDNRNGLWVRIKPSGNSFRMDKLIDNTVSTVVESTVDVFVVQVQYALRLDAAGTGAGQNFDGYFAGTLRLNPAALDAVLDDGEPGIGLLNGGGGSGSGVNIDNFRIEGAAAGGANPHGPLGHPLFGPLAGPIAA